MYCIRHYELIMFGKSVCIVYGRKRLRLRSVLATEKMSVNLLKSSGVLQFHVNVEL